MQLLSVVSLLRPPTELLWAPHSVAAGDASLCILNGGTKMYLWTPDGASCIHVPLPNFRPQSGSFGGGGAVLALGDQRALCCAYTAT